MSGHQSSEKHYCKYCNLWLQGDKISIRHHERSQRHLDKVQEKIKHKRQAQAKELQNEKELKRQLINIEKAAQARFARDIAGSAGPIKKKKETFHAFQHRSYAPSSENRIEALPVQSRIMEPIQAESDDAGIYCVRGQVYLDGKIHVSQLIPGNACEIWMEELEEWKEAVIESRMSHTIPNTVLALERYKIIYAPSKDAEAKTLTDIPSDRLRLKMPAGMTVQDVLDMLRSKVKKIDSHVVRHDIDETTGMGEWSTVVVRQIDNSAAHKEEETEDFQAENVEYEPPTADSAFNAFNPFGSSIYKGVNLTSDTFLRSKQDRELLDQASADIQFKQHTSSKQKTKKRRRIEMDR